MRGIAVATVGFVVGGAFVLAVGLMRTDSPSVSTSRPLASPSMHAQGAAMGSSALATRRLTIQHVQKGCHVWSDGSSTGAAMVVRLRVGQKLSIVDHDVDAHRLMQLSGPMHLRMGGPMMMNEGTTLAFATKGVYRLATETVEMAGGDDEMEEAETTGPDNTLRLTVRVV